MIYGVGKVDFIYIGFTVLCIFRCEDENFLCQKSKAPRGYSLTCRHLFFLKAISVLEILIILSCHLFE